MESSRSRSSSPVGRLYTTRGRQHLRNNEETPLLDDSDADISARYVDSPNLAVLDNESSSEEAAPQLTEQALKEHTILQESFLESIEIAGYNPVDQTINGRPIAEVEGGQAYIDQTSVQASSFFLGAFTGYRDDMFYETWVDEETLEAVPSNLRNKTNAEAIAALREAAHDRADDAEDALRAFDLKHKYEELTDKQQQERDALLAKCDEADAFAGREITLIRAKNREALAWTIAKNWLMLPKGGLSFSGKNHHVGWTIAWLALSPIIVPVRTAYFGLSVAGTTIKNTFKAAFELLPNLARKGLNEAEKQVQAKRDELEGAQFLTFDDLKYWALTALFGLIQLGILGAAAVQFIGRQILSPKKAADEAAKFFKSEWARIPSYLLSIVLTIITAAMFKAYIAPLLQAFFQKVVPQALVWIAEKCHDFLEWTSKYTATSWINTTVDAMGKFFTETLPNLFTADWIVNTVGWIRNAADAVYTYALEPAYNYFFHPIYTYGIEPVYSHVIQPAMNFVYDTVYSVTEKIANALFLLPNWIMGTNFDIPYSAMIGAFAAIGTQAVAAYEFIAKTTGRYVRNAENAAKSADAVEIKLPVIEGDPANNLADNVRGQLSIIKTDIANIKSSHAATQRRLADQGAELLRQKDQIQDQAGQISDANRRFDTLDAINDRQDKAITGAYKALEDLPKAQHDAAGALALAHQASDAVVKLDEKTAKSFRARGQETNDRFEAQGRILNQHHARLFPAPADVPPAPAGQPSQATSTPTLRNSVDDQSNT